MFHTRKKNQLSELISLSQNNKTKPQKMRVVTQMKIGFIVPHPNFK